MRSLDQNDHRNLQEGLTFSSFLQEERGSALAPTGPGAWACPWERDGGCPVS